MMNNQNGMSQGMMNNQMKQKILYQKGITQNIMNNQNGMNHVS
jgi:hypothetical protein